MTPEKPNNKIYEDAIVLIALSIVLSYLIYAIL
jgi:hypothetical protein